MLPARLAFNETLALQLKYSELRCICRFYNSGPKVYRPGLKRKVEGTAGYPQPPRRREQIEDRITRIATGSDSELNRKFRRSTKDAGTSYGDSSAVTSGQGRSSRPGEEDYDVLMEGEESGKAVEVRQELVKEDEADYDSEAKTSVVPKHAQPKSAGHSREGEHSPSRRRIPANMTIPSPTGAPTKAMPTFSGKKLPTLNASALPQIEQCSAAYWQVRMRWSPEPVVYPLLTLAGNLQELAKRAPYRDVFMQSKSIHHLLLTVSRLRGHDAIESNFASCLQNILAATYNGRHRALVAMLYKSQRHTKSREARFVVEKFTSLVDTLCKRVHTMSDVGAAVCLGALHNLDGQRLFTQEDMSLQANRVYTMPLSSAIVFADALSTVPSWQQGQHHDLLMKVTVRAIGEKMVHNQASSPLHKDPRPVETPNFSNDQVVAFLAILSRCRHFPIAGWSGMKSFIARNIWSFSSEEVGLLLHSMNTIGVKPSKNLCDAVSLRVEEGLNSFSFISRISSVQFLLNAGRRCNATVVALLRESHYVNDTFVKAHPYLASSLHDILMLLWLTDRKRFLRPSDHRLAYIRDHLWRVKCLAHSNYYPKFKNLATSDEPLGTRPAFESLLLPVLTTIQCNTRPGPSLDGDEQENEAVQSARVAADSILYYRWVNGVKVVAAILCDENGDFVPWQSALHVLGPQPGWWKEGAEPTVIAGQVHCEDVLELSGKSNGPTQQQLGSGSSAGIELASSTSSEPEKRLKLQASSTREERMQLELEAEEMGDTQFKSKTLQYISLDKVRMKKAGVQFRPVAICVYDDQMSLIKPKSSILFNGFVKTQSNILFQSGWACVNIPYSDIGMKRSTTERQAVLYHHLSKILNLPSRDDLVEAVPRWLLQKEAVQEVKQAEEGFQEKQDKR